ncbi:MAG: group II intron reverse transcriptase/maturase [Burkholderiales bacterium]|nr:group II intron reverse transcriptase/maturase [Burkholderiales bacterium]
MIKPTISTQELQRRIGHRAKSALEHRFWGLYVHLGKLETLEAAYLEAKRKGGAPGSDAETFKAIEDRGRHEFLAELAAEVKNGTYKPRPYRRREIPKEGGKVRTISIPAIRDRVIQGALRLLLEPIFEADFSRHSFGARPGRSAHDAIAEVRSGLIWKKHLVVDVDLKSFFDDIGHAPLLAKIARRIQDDRILAIIKQFLKSTGRKGIPQGSPLSPLLANVALNDLDHILGRGFGYLSYARYLDDMVVLTFDSKKGRRWAARALDRIRQEAEAIGVSLNVEKTRTVRLTDPGTSFAFLGFSIRWQPNPTIRKGYAHTSPRRKKVIEVLRKVRETLRSSRHLSVRDAVARVNPIVRGWVNYFRVGNSTRELHVVRTGVERKVRRFAVKKRKRKGFGWTRWSSEVVYGTWGLFDDYRVRHHRGRAKASPIGTDP